MSKPVSAEMPESFKGTKEQWEAELKAAGYEGATEIPRETRDSIVESFEDDVEEELEDEYEDDDEGGEDDES